MKGFIRPAARDDIIRQYRYFLVNQDNPIIAESFLRAVRSEIKRVCKTPAVGSPMLVKNLQLAGLRSCFVEGFPSIRIYYLATSASVSIVRVLHGKRDVHSILEDEI